MSVTDIVKKATRFAKSNPVDAAKAAATVAESAKHTGDADDGRINKLLSAAGNALDTLGTTVDLLPAFGLDDAAAGTLKVAAGLTKSVGKLADGDFKKAGREIAGGMVKAGVALIPLAEYGDAAAQLTTGKSISERIVGATGGAKAVDVESVGSFPDHPPSSTRDLVRQAKAAAADKHGRN